MAKVHYTLGAADGAREIKFDNAVYDTKTSPSLSVWSQQIQCYSVSLQIW